MECKEFEVWKPYIGNSQIVYPKMEFQMDIRMAIWIGYRPYGTSFIETSLIVTQSFSSGEPANAGHSKIMNVLT